MNEEYSEYLHSDEWQRKRNRRLAMSGGRCEACGSNKRVEVHHLTYEHIYNEEMADLLPLCFLHHAAAEEMIRKGSLSRSGNPTKLARDTLAIIVPRKVEAKVKRRIPDGAVARIPPRNRSQEMLLQEPWFADALQLKRNAFKKEVRKRFDGHQYRNSIISNCFALYQRKGAYGKA